MYQTFDELGFKPGDIVKCLKSSYKHEYEVGKTYKLIEGKIDTIITGGWTGFSAEWEKVEEMEFEDQWHLNDGKVIIPDDADKLEKDGSVVAFRKRKVKPFEFGEKLRIKKSLWPKYVIEPKNINPGLDYVDAVYISKRFDSDGVESIHIYINDGENGWECCLDTLDKVERLT